MDRNEGPLRGDATNVLVLRTAERCSRKDRGVLRDASAQRQRLLLLLRKHRLLPHVLYIHHGACAGDGDRLFESPHTQLRIRRRGEACRELEGLTLEVAEARESKRDGVD